MQSKKQFKLILNSKVFFIPSDFTRINDISPNIYHSLINEQQYVLQSIVSDEVMQSFIDYLVKNINPNINSNNKIEYFQLSLEFNVMNNLINSVQDTIDYYLHNINILNDHSLKDKSQIENIITLQLDEYIMNCGEQLLFSPIQSLYRIFNNNKRNLTKQNLCYYLIKQHYEKTKNSNIFILLKCLDSENLNKENIIDSIESRNSRFGMIPNIESSYFSSMNEKIDFLVSKIKTLEDENKKKDEEIKKLTENLIEVRFNLNEENESDVFKYDFLIPTGKKWKIGKDQTEYKLSDNNQSYTVFSSSTYNNYDNHAPYNLFNGKTEVDSGHRWASIQSPKSSQFIIINFEKPVTANTLSMTSRQHDFKDQAPIIFQILVSNDNKNYNILKIFSGIEWANDNKKIFLFKNENSYSWYKIEFISSRNPYHDIGLAELNLGKVKFI